MPSEEFFNCVQAVMKMPTDDLPYLHVIVTEAMRKQGIPITAQGQQINTAVLTANAVKLLQSGVELTGWETALLAGVILQFGGFTGAGVSEAAFDSRSITGELRRYPDRTIANITSATDSLRERGLLEEDGTREKGAHRTFRLSLKGQNEALKLWDRHATSVAA